MESEVKILLPADAWSRLNSAAGLEEPVRRSVWFFETRERLLGSGGIIVRRRVGENESDATVKLRGEGPLDEIWSEFKDDKGAKYENDCSANTCKIAISLTAKHDTALGAGALIDPSTLLSVRQLDLIRRVPVAIPWERVKQLGPIASETWKRKKLDLTVERWTVGDTQIIEVSQRSEKDWQVTLEGLRSLLDRWQILAEGLPGGKTKWALDRLIMNA